MLFPHHTLNFLTPRFFVRHVRLVVATASVSFVFLFILLDRDVSNLQSVCNLPCNKKPIPDLGKNSVCNGKLNVSRILLVLRVHPSYNDTRQYVRKKIQSSSECRLRIIFLYGRFTGPNSVDFQNTLNHENAHHGDILQFLSVEDYWLSNGRRAIKIMKSWLASNFCTFYQQIVFGKFEPEKIHQVPRPSIEERIWELDACLKLSDFKRTNIQFLAHYFPSLHYKTSYLVSEALSQSSMYTYNDKVVSPHSFSYRTEPSEYIGLCGKMKTARSYFAIIAIHSGTYNFAQRKKIRSTWGHPDMKTKHNVSLLFFLGWTESYSLQDLVQLKMESEIHQDIVQGDFVESYRNLTIKQISIMKYLTEKCSIINYKYLFKTDDDIVIDLKPIVRYIKKVQGFGLPPQRTIFCFHMNEVTYVPRYANKWFVSRTEYPDKFYPAYCSGAGYLITKDLIPSIYEAASHIKAFWVDDTYVSGMLPQAIGDISLIQIPKQSLVNVDALRRNESFNQKMILHVNQDLRVFQTYWEKYRLKNKIDFG